MTMVMQNQSRHYGNIGYAENMYSSHLHTSPQFTDPWGSHSASQAHSPAYAPSMPKQEVPRSMPMSYSQVPVSAPGMVAGGSYSNAGLGSSDLLSIGQDIPRSTYPSDQTYQSSPQNSTTFNPSSYPSLSYAHPLPQQQHSQEDVRKLSDAGDQTARTEPPSFGELDASHGMLALSHQNLTDLTPRNVYEARNPRNSTDGYGFPSHSLSSSISGTSHRDSYPYYSASVTSGDSSTDYSSAASDAGYDSVPASRTLPRPSQLVGANLGPPAPQSMMSQFSSKMTSNTQKKHKCKVCDKRFTRPSSLQTHMYSHTGEKPFACTVEGCGRHFSVVSNLRRHQKVHKDETASSHSDEDD